MKENYILTIFSISYSRCSIWDIATLNNKLPETIKYTHIFKMQFWYSILSNLIFL